MKDVDINFSHRSVLLDECIENLKINPSGIYIDATVGGGGHSLEIVKRPGGEGKLIAVDQDSDALRAAGERLNDYSDKVIFVKSNFSYVADICKNLGIDKIDGILMDLGVSSYQLDNPERGFSHNNSARLDMRMDRDGVLDAYAVVNTYSQEELKRIIYEYGEERYAPSVASAIVRERMKKPIDTTEQLVKIIKDALPPSARNGSRHPAKKTFQAIRIEVNGELDVIAPAINSAIGLLKNGGRIAVITFHSLEDRIVKQSFAKFAEGCTCPKTLPLCVCGKVPLIKNVTKKPILPSDKEVGENPRSRSAKLRVAEKIL